MKKNIPFVSVIIILLLAALTWQQFHMNTLIQTNNALLKKVDLYKTQFEKLDYQLNQLNEENQNTNEATASAYYEALKSYQLALERLNEEFREQVNIIAQQYSIEELLAFKLEDEEGIAYIDHYGILDSRLNDKNKLQYVADYLNTHYFDGTNIEVKSIENINGKKIAFINLSEKQLLSSEDSDVKKGWLPLYFQGSSGGSMTETILIEGFLQRQLLNWPIDAVEFLYDNEPIVFDHVPNLEFIQYRN